MICNRWYRLLFVLAPPLGFSLLREAIDPIGTFAPLRIVVHMFDPFVIVPTLLMLFWLDRVGPHFKK
jgi:hypothetical protein